MLYTTTDGKTYRIPNELLDNYQKSLGLTPSQALDLWLEDNNLQENAELVKLEKKIAEKEKEEKKKKKVSAEKTELFNDIYSLLSKKYNVSLEVPGKVMNVELNGKKFKINLTSKSSKS